MASPNDFAKLAVLDTAVGDRNRFASRLVAEFRGAYLSCQRGCCLAVAGM